VIFHVAQVSDKAVRHVIGQPQNPIPVLPKPPFSIEIGQVHTDDDASVERKTIVDRGKLTCCAQPFL